MRKIIYPFTKTFISGLLFFFILNSELHAQSKDSAKHKISKATISLKNGATLYSADSVFNRQISANKIISEKAAVSYHENAKGDRTLKMSPPKTDSVKHFENSAVLDKKSLPKSK